ncbi:MAG: TaqI-like C-terminal specificity domain-containing protein [Smithellaceae bacterium]
MKVKKDFTPARRWSFLVGVSEKSHTAQRRLVDILANDEESPTLAELEEAFNIETVTKEFFIEYRNLFLRVKEALDAIVAKNATIKNNFEENGVNTVDFSKKLLGQIVFLYFLQKKGWFGVARDETWGTGSKQFLRELFQKKHGGYKNLFNDILEPLFYDALRIDRSHDDHYYSRFNCKIPFLNGGLFDPLNNYDWVHTDILIPNELFSNKHKTKAGDEGDGILDVFDRYNFTVKEDEPLEKEVAIDPELLGKAYEKFNAIRPDNFDEYRRALKSGKKGEESKFNKQFGVYYTPREIVHYMCQQSLINYLFCQCNGGMVTYEKPGVRQTDLLGNIGKEGQLDLTIEHKEIPAIPKEDFETLIHYGERLSDNEEMALIKRQKIKDGHQKTSDYKLQLPDSIRNNATEIDNKLAGIKVCDPAIGSGAFPVGMMSEIVRARNTLSTFVKNTDRSIYHFKRDCIENSLYGVDIDPGAVEIAKLRLWLSLVVDEDDIRNIRPLPNLDYKIVCGNSLLGVEKNLFNNQLFADLEKIKPLYFNETNPTKKQNYKKQIDELIKRITNGHKEFDFEVYFSEVFHERGGFDVVIANPPYVEFKNLDKKIKSILNNFKTTRGKYDIYIPFIEKAFYLLKYGGLSTYICPTRFMQRNYGEMLRKFICEEDCAIEKIVDFSDLQIFEGAMNYTGIFMLAKQKHASYRFLYKKVYNNLAISNEQITQILHSKSSTNFSRVITVDSDDLSTTPWYFEKGIHDPIFTKMRTSGKELEEISLGIYQGISTGKDSVFIIDGKCIQEWGIEKEILQPFLKGKDISGYRIGWSGKYLIYPYNNSGDVISELSLKKYYPKAYTYLLSQRAELAGRDYFENSNKEWYELWNQRNLSRFKVKKIVTLDNASKNSFALDLQGFIGTTTVYSIILKEDDLQTYKFVLALLNSSLLNYYHKKNTVPQAGGFYRYQTSLIKHLPIRMASREKWAQITVIVDKILSLTQSDDYLQNLSKQAKVKKYEKEIDQLVYNLYGLSEDEIKIVEDKGV